MQIGQMLGRFALAVAIAYVAASAGWGQVTDGVTRRVALLAAIEGLCWHVRDSPGPYPPIRALRPRALFRSGLCIGIACLER